MTSMSASEEQFNILHQKIGYVKNVLENSKEEKKVDDRVTGLASQVWHGDVQQTHEETKSLIQELHELNPEDIKGDLPENFVEEVQEIIELANEILYSEEAGMGEQFQKTLSNVEQKVRKKLSKLVEKQEEERSQKIQAFIEKITAKGYDKSKIIEDINENFPSSKHKQALFNKLKELPKTDLNRLFLEYRFNEEEIKSSDTDKVIIKHLMEDEEFTLEDIYDLMSFENLQVDFKQLKLSHQDRKTGDNIMHLMYRYGSSDDIDFARKNFFWFCLEHYENKLGLSPIEVLMARKLNFTNEKDIKSIPLESLIKVFIEKKIPLEDIYDFMISRYENKIVPQDRMVSFLLPLIKQKIPFAKIYNLMKFHNSLVNFEHLDLELLGSQDSETGDNIMHFVCRHGSLDDVRFVRENFANLKDQENKLGLQPVEVLMARKLNLKKEKEIKSISLDESHIKVLIEKKVPLEGIYSFMIIRYENKIIPRDRMLSFLLPLIKQKIPFEKIYDLMRSQNLKVNFEHLKLGSKESETGDNIMHFVCRHGSLDDVRFVRENFANLKDQENKLGLQPVEVLMARKLNLKKEKEIKSISLDESHIKVLIEKKIPLEEIYSFMISRYENKIIPRDRMLSFLLPLIKQKNLFAKIYDLMRSQNLKVNFEHLKLCNKDSETGDNIMHFVCRHGSLNDVRFVRENLANLKDQENKLGLQPAEVLMARKLNLKNEKEIKSFDKKELEKKFFKGGYFQAFGNAMQAVSDHPERFFDRTNLTLCSIGSLEDICYAIKNSPDSFLPKSKVGFFVGFLQSAIARAFGLSQKERKEYFREYSVDTSKQTDTTKTGLNILKQRQDVLTGKTKDGNNVLHAFCESGALNYLPKILNSFPPELLYQKNNKHISPIGILLDRFGYEKLTSIIDSLDNDAIRKEITSSPEFLAGRILFESPWNKGYKVESKKFEPAPLVDGKPIDINEMAKSIYEYGIKIGGGIVDENGEMKKNLLGFLNVINKQEAITGVPKEKEKFYKELTEFLRHVTLALTPIKGDKKAKYKYKPPKALFSLLRNFAEIYRERKCGGRYMGEGKAAYAIVTGQNIGETSEHKIAEHQIRNACDDLKRNILRRMIEIIAPNLNEADHSHYFLELQQLIGEEIGLPEASAGTYDDVYKPKYLPSKEEALKIFYEMFTPERILPEITEQIERRGGSIYQGYVMYLLQENIPESYVPAEIIRQEVIKTIESKRGEKLSPDQLKEKAVEDRIVKESYLQEIACTAGAISKLRKEALIILLSNLKIIKTDPKNIELLMQSCKEQLKKEKAEHAVEEEIQEISKETPKDDKIIELSKKLEDALLEKQKEELKIEHKGERFDFKSTKFSLKNATKLFLIRKLGDFNKAEKSSSENWLMSSMEVEKAYRADVENASQKFTSSMNEHQLKQEELVKYKKLCRFKELKKAEKDEYLESEDKPELEELKKQNLDNALDNGLNELEKNQSLLKKYEDLPNDNERDVFKTENKSDYEKIQKLQHLRKAVDIEKEKNNAIEKHNKISEPLNQVLDYIKSGDDNIQNTFKKIIEA